MNGAVITARNEAGNIGYLVNALREQGLSACVVDDGSGDATGEIAQQAGAHVIYHAESKGIGRSLIEAWKYAISQRWEYTIQIDAGGSHAPDEWRYAPNCDVAIGSRFTKGSIYYGRPQRARLSRWLAYILNWTTSRKISDWTSGYRVFSLRALMALTATSYITNMHTWQIEVIGVAIQKGLSISEFPIYYTAGNSSLRPVVLLDLFKVYLWILNL